MSTRQPDTSKVVGRLASRFGLRLRGETGTDENGVWIQLQAADLHPNEGFSIRVTLGWRSIRAAVVPGNWAASLLQEMGLAPTAKKSAFVSLAKAILNNGGRIFFSVNGSQVDPLDFNLWPSDWKELRLEIDSGPLDQNMMDVEQLERGAIYWGSSLLGLVVCLLPLEEEALPDLEHETEGIPEGAKSRIEVNKYERSQINRALCISVHGCSCRVCGFDFAATYGTPGEGYIHVHHIVPISTVGAEYVIDPTRDLVPLCPNCHAIVHRRNPPFSVDEVKAMLTKT